MRIISGNFKGKKILQPKDLNTRPLKDLTKESIFNIIKHSNKFDITIEGAQVLDLFSGVGSFGIECISRGVKKVFFIENYNSVLPILRRNLNNLAQIDNFEILEKDIYKDNVFEKLNCKFDIIFLDPPFKDKNLDKVLLKIKNTKILKNKSIIIIHKHKKDLWKIPSYIKTIETKQYGISKIFFVTF